MTIDATDPIDTSGDSLDPAQVCWTTEGENYDRGQPGIGSATRPDYSDGDAGKISADENAFEDLGADYLEWDFTPDHTIPSDEFGVHVRDWDGDDDDGTPALEWYIADSNGNEQIMNELGIGNEILLSWTDIGDGEYPVGDGYTDDDLTAGETYTLGVRVTDSDGSGDQYTYTVDVVAPFDKRFESVLNFDNSVHQSDGYLDGPELYPDVVPVQLTTTETRRDVTEATAEIDTNTTDANQYIELRIGSDAFDRTNNSATASTTGGPARSIDVTLGLTRYPDDSNPQSATPRYGYNGQSVDSYSLTANPSAINASGLAEAEVDAIVGQGEITGDRIEEAAELTASDDALTRSILAPFDVFAETSLRSSEKVSFNNDE